MLIEKIQELSMKSGSASSILSELESSLSNSSQKEILDLLFNTEAEKARKFVDSFLDQYDERRNEILRRLANDVPEEHRTFFIHAFSRRISDDDL